MIILSYILIFLAGALAGAVTMVTFRRDPAADAELRRHARADAWRMW